MKQIMKRIGTAMQRTRLRVSLWHLDSEERAAEDEVIHRRMDLADAEIYLYGLQLKYRQTRADLQRQLDALQAKAGA